VIKLRQLSFVHPPPFDWCKTRFQRENNRKSFKKRRVYERSHTTQIVIIQIRTSYRPTRQNEFVVLGKMDSSHPSCLAAEQIVGSFGWGRGTLTGWIYFAEIVSGDRPGRMDSFHPSVRILRAEQIVRMLGWGLRTWTGWVSFEEIVGSDRPPFKKKASKSTGCTKENCLSLFILSK
jgi:hypothetical protein